MTHIVGPDTAKNNVVRKYTLCWMVAFIFMTKFLHFFQLILLFFSIFILLFSILILFFSKQLEHQFSQLKQEILNSDRSMETLFSLIQELTNAAEKYFALKRLFWKVHVYVV